MFSVTSQAVSTFTTACLPKGTRMTARTRLSLAAVAVVFVGVLAWRIGLVGGPEPVPAPPLPPFPAPEGHNGLSDEERSRYYRLSEGGELYPLDWILALETETTGQNGLPQVRPFLDNIERYGLLPDAKNEGNPFGLPVGVSVGRSKISGLLMIGLNCTACHVGELHYQGRAMRMDGGPNMALVNVFITEMFDETKATVESPRRLRRFWSRVRDVRRDRRAAEASGEADTAPDETLWARVVGLVTDNRGLLRARLDVARNLPTLQLSVQIGTAEGYGRVDAFGMGRDELFGAIGANSLPPDAPVSFPHTWGMEYTGWLQWGANTNSVMERNIGQALGVGATFDPRTYESTVSLENLHELEQFSYKLTAPAWPDFMPPIDTAKAARGEALFRKYCVECHETFELDGPMRIYQKFALDDVGTDPATAINFERPVLLPNGQVQPFPYAALDLIKRIKQRAYQDAGFDQAKIDEYEQRHIRTGPRWDPTFRATLLDSEKWPDTRGRRIYRAKTLVGIWATAPFLHNGSVPTIFDLLKPAAERPMTFPVGQREYDPVKLGYQTDPSKFAWAPNQAPYEFDTRIGGNWNTGHEWHFYPELTDDRRYEIIEFLKTFTAALPGTSGAR